MTDTMLSRRTLFAVLAASVAVGCSTADPGVASSAIPKAKEFLEQVRPSDLGRTVEAVQLVTVTQADRVFVTEVRLSISADRLKLVAQDMLGQRLMSVDWNGASLVEERSPSLPSSVAPGGLLADLVAICWPEAVVRAGLSKIGANLVVQGDRRTVMSGGRETLVATLGWQPAGPWTGRMSYRNVRADYRVDVQSVEQQP